MPRKSFTPEQIIQKLREAEVLIAQGMSAQQAARQIGVSEQSYYRWRKEYGGLRVEQAKQVKPAFAILKAESHIFRRPKFLNYKGETDLSGGAQPLNRRVNAFRWVVTGGSRVQIISRSTKFGPHVDLGTVGYTRQTLENNKVSQYGP